MWKDELKQQLELYTNINTELTTKICYLLLWKNKYIKARLEDWLKIKNIEDEIKKFNFDFEIVKDKLFEHYKNKWLIL